MNSTRLLVTTILMALVLPVVGSRSHLVRADRQAMCHLTGWDWVRSPLFLNPDFHDGCVSWALTC